MTAARASYLRHRNYQAVSLAHFLVDVLNSSRSLLVAILAVSIGLSNAQVGIALMLYNVGNALTQPFFGRLADRYGARWLVIGGLGWMIVFYSLAALLAPWPALAAVTIAGLGSGAFHPTGTMVASEASHTHRTQATSIFFMAGQTGLFAGPILAGILLANRGRSGYIVLPLLALAGFFYAWKYIPREQPHHGDEEERRDAAVRRARIEHLTRRAVLLSLIILAVGTVSAATINFAPILFTELGYDAAYVGLLSGLFMLGSAVGGVVGGTLSDRWNGRVVILLAAAGSIVPLLFYIPAAGSGRFLLLLAAGFFVGMPHSVLVLMVQGLLPGLRATASGLALGFMFFSGSIGTFVIGLLADSTSLEFALRLAAFIPLVTILTTLILPKKETAA